MTILQTVSPTGIGLSGQSHNPLERPERAASTSYLVLRQSSPPQPIACRSGLSREGIEVALEGYAELRHRRHRPFIVTIGVTHHSEPEKHRRIRAIKTMIGTYQKRSGLQQPEYIEIMECTPSLHSHLIVAAPNREAGNRMMEALILSQSYPEIDAKWPDRERGGIVTLLSNYLCKETTPQAAYGIRARQEAGTWLDGGFSRIPNAQRGAPITGDRVRLSGSLAASLPAYRKTYTARSIDKHHEINAVLEPSAPTWPPIQLGLPMALPAPIDFRAIAEARRIEAGLTQREAAARIGIRQPHWSNTIQGKRDAFSAWRWNRIRQFVDELGRAA